MVMENGSNHYEPRRTGSFGRTSSASSSLRRRSFSISSVVPSQVEDEIESETVSEAGDIGDRALHSNRFSASGSLRLDNNDSALENGLAFSVPENNLLQSYGFWSRDATTLNTVSAVSPLPEEIKSPLATKPLVCSEDKNQGKVIPKPLEYISCLIHLAFFGILGVLTRYLLQKLFGPKVAGVTSNLSILYLDLPSNMVGSFLMGWFGVVFKADISRVSDYLAIGLSTGYLGSLTTFSGWNQKMLDLTIGGNWVFAFLGFFIGLFLAAYSIIFGVETAKGFRWLLNRWHKSSTKGTPPDSSSNFKVDTFMRHLSVMLVLVLMLGGLLSLSGVLLRKEFNSGSDEAQLWLGCIVAPLGVWMRWFLARLNGRGLGRAGTLKWVPFGTLIANIAAAGVMTALATVKKTVNTQTCNTVASGLQFGLMGCLSTVSTFMAEFNAMRESKYPWRAYAYALTTILVSFGMGILIYSVPVWTMKLEEHV